MQARTRWWLISILVLVVAALLGVFEPVKLRDRTDPNTGEIETPLKQVGQFRFYRPHFGITQGLDLRGGSHLVLQAQGRAVYEFSAKELSEERSDEEEAELYGEIVNLLPAEAIGAEKRDVQLRDDRIVVLARLENNNDAFVREQADRIKGLLAELFPDVETKVAERRPITHADLVSIQRIIEERVNSYGVTEPVIQRQGQDRLVVELPGVKDPERAKQLIKQTAVLEFRHIPRKYAYGEGSEDARGMEVSEVAGKRVFTFRDPTGKEVPTAQVIDESPVIATGEDLKPESSRVYSIAGRPTAVGFELQGEGAKRFEDFTRGHINHYLAIVLDGQMITAPIIRSTIPGRGEISGNFDRPGGLAEARDLSILLNAGALPFDLEYIENRTVSAQLGQDALQKSLIAGLIGLGLVLVFMALYYRLPGLLADLALIIYCILLLGAIKLVNQVLTLPGILAVILSIGMAVDANIIIFERLKEEIRTGKTMRSAVEAAFKRAWAAILDSNVCSIGTGFVLFHFGTGPIKGFAVALIIGVAVSLFTAVTVTRLFVNIVMNTSLARNVMLFGVSPREVGEA
ncbi:MAG: protein translocase subunit SecD [Armatimonadetes bacterium]|nr:protein translocase subunit SecD [Armatimonadota bacterium]